MGGGFIYTQELNHLSTSPHFSIIIPVYNRPEELDELLMSLSSLEGTRDFEVIVVEDGSSRPSEEVVRTHESDLNIRYICQENTGPGGARNRGAEVAVGEMFIFLDSDTVLPPGYLEEVREALNTNPVPLWGGPDRASEDFTEIQQAISYSMTSFFTTGGIRGGKQKLDKFYPRSFNMGVSAEVFREVQGFAKLRFGEDLDLSMRILEQGYASALFPKAWVYHKRRVNWRQFYKQVYNSGIARINLQILHPGSLKAVHLLPSLFVIFHVIILIGALAGYPYLLIFPLLYMLMIVVDVFVRTGWMSLAFHSVVAAYVQLFGYGLGFLHAAWRRLVRGKGNFSGFDKNFYE